MRLVTLFSRRTAAVAVAPLFALGALAPIAPAAEATVVVTNHYNCYGPGSPGAPPDSGPSVGTLDLTIEMSGWEGMDVVAAARHDWPELSFDNHVTIPEQLYSDMAELGAQSVEMSGLSMPWSDGRQGPAMSAVGAHWGIAPTFAFSEFVAGSAGRTASFAATDDADLFPLRAGTYDLLSPSVFTISVHGDGGYLYGWGCFVDPAVGPAALHHVTLFKTDSITSARPTRAAFPAGDPAKVKVEVTSPDWLYWADGVVKLKDKAGHTLAKATLKKSKALLTAKGLPVGAHRLKVVYSGDGRYFGSRTPVTLRVK